MITLKNVDKNGNNLPIRVYKDDKGKYAIPISKKVGEEYQNRYYPVEFLKGVELENKTSIIIKNAFITWFDWEFDDRKGTKYPIKILSFEVVEEKPKEELKQETTTQSVDKWDAGKEIEIKEDELPFY